jgi:hypothetical protein
MGACFEKMDEELMLDNESGGGDVETGTGVLSVKNMGSTAVVVMVGKEEVAAAANCGGFKGGYMSQRRGCAFVS